MNWNKAPIGPWIWIVAQDEKLKTSCKPTIIATPSRCFFFSLKGSIWLRQYLIWVGWNSIRKIYISDYIIEILLNRQKSTVYHFLLNKEKIWKFLDLLCVHWMENEPLPKSLSFLYLYFLYIFFLNEAMKGTLTVGKNSSQTN